MINIQKRFFGYVRATYRKVNTFTLYIGNVVGSGSGEELAVMQARGMELAGQTGVG